MPKKEVKAHVSSKRWTRYEIKDDKIIRKKSCPKCGPGIFLAEHSNRFNCGKCHYVEMKK